jgi:hypothetical protein
MEKVFPVLFVLFLSAAFSQALLFKSKPFSVYSTKIVQGKYEASAESPIKIVSNYESSDQSQIYSGISRELITKEWILTRDVSLFPQFHSDQVLVDALYTKALQEMLLDVRTDGAFMAGAKWDGVWTRDISYSILLSLAIINPDVAKVSLKVKVKNNRIIQDTGTGGSWPVSTDRMIWALAAWEVYVVTGDEEWLRYAYSVIKNSIQDDMQNAVNPSTGLMHGESSFLDWREQTYPRWMDPKDIYQSQALGTNAVHFRTYQILADMENLCGDNSKIYLQCAENIKNGIDRYLWLEDKGYYGQYLYGRVFHSVSQKSEALGEALVVLFDVAEDKRARTIISKTPVVEFGIPCIYPQIPDIPPYHNNAIWPFVEAYWAWASAKAGNVKSVEHGLASIYRAAALFNTNKENMVAGSGDYAGTQINSDRQLWSVAGCLATVYRIFYGMSFTRDGLALSPFVPPAYGGNKSLSNFKYRDADLTINLKGTGSKIKSVLLDSVIIPAAVISSKLKGKHTLDILLEHNPDENTSINLVQNEFAPETPMVRKEGEKLVWQNIADACIYHIYKNGWKIAESQKEYFGFPKNMDISEYQVLAVNNKGFESFLSEPVEVVNDKDVTLLDASEARFPLQSEYKGFTKKGYIRLEKDGKQKVEFKTEVQRAGLYRIDIRYANGNGPINTDNKCAIRTLLVNDKSIGSVVMPQRGAGIWSDWGFSSSLFVRIEKGINTVALVVTSFNSNMNVDENIALIDYFRLTFVSDK